MNARSDARNRAVRTFLQNMAIDVVVALLLILAPVVAEAESLADFDWPVLAFMVSKTVVATVISYLMRVLNVLPGSIDDDQGA